MSKFFYALSIVVVVFSSCVVNRKTVPLQFEEELKSDEKTKNEVVRSYDIESYNYKLQPEDIISIDVVSLTPDEYNFFKSENTQTQINRESSLIQGYLIDIAGEIQFPVVGGIKIEGLSLPEAEKLLQTKAGSFLKAPVVKVRLLNFRITVLGEVISPGAISFFNNRTNISELLGLTGGPSDLADLSNVKVLRHTKNKVEVHYVNLLDEKVIESPFYYLHNNDVIIIPPLRQKPFRKYFGSNLSLVLSSLSLLVLSFNILK